MIEFLSGRRSGADTVVNVATIEFRFRAIVLTEKFVLDVAYEKIGIAGSHFCTHNHTIDLFIITAPTLTLTLSSDTTEERFNSTRRTEGRDLYLTKIISEIGEFSHLIDCHGVCGNNNEVSFVTNLLVEFFFL